MGTNRYTYSFNDPVNLSDRNGHASWAEIWGDFKNSISDAATGVKDGAVAVYEDPAGAITGAGKGLANTAHSLFWYNSAGPYPTGLSFLCGFCGSEPPFSFNSTSEQAGAFLGVSVVGILGARTVIKPQFQSTANRFPVSGDLTRSEVRQIQSVTNEVGRPLHVVGSAARGQRRLESDIDYVASPSSMERFMVDGIQDRLPGIDPSHGIVPGYPVPQIGPYISFYPK